MMHENRLKLAAVSALRSNPDFSSLQALDSASEREVRAFLRWLDHSGLALYLAWQLRQNAAFEETPVRLRAHLQSILRSNCVRTELMLSDFRRISESLRARGVPHAFLKGFTLTPDFCPRPQLRHQSDIDVLISPQAQEQATAALFDCEYSCEHKLPGGEIHYSTGLSRIPSVHDDIYTADFQKEVELHTSIWEDIEGVSLQVPGDCLERRREREVKSIAFASLSREDVVVAQFLHAFRHFLSSWVRLAWLWEIHYFLSGHAGDSSLWIAVCNRGGNDPFLRNGFGLILRLTNHLFGSPIPQVLREWCIEPLPARIHCWVLELGAPWALSETPGSKLSLLIHKEFMRDTRTWRAYLWRRLIPLRGKASLAKTDCPDVQRLLRFKISHRMFQARRSAFHVRSLLSFPFEIWRWRRALAQSHTTGHSLIEARANQHL